MEGYKTEDPRSKSIKYSNSGRSRFSQEQFDFAPTKFIIDANYVGEPPHIQVGIVNLNDNINEDFLGKDLAKLGQIRMLQIVRNPQTNEHLGLAKVEFEDVAAAGQCVANFNGKHLMGKQLQVFVDVRFNAIEKIKENKLHSKPPISQAVVSPQPTPAHHPVLPLNPEYLLVTPSSITSSAAATPEPTKRPKTLDDRIAQILKKPKYSHNPTSNQIPPPLMTHFKPLNVRQEMYYPYNKQHFNEQRVEESKQPKEVERNDDDDWDVAPKPMSIILKDFGEDRLREIIDPTSKMFEQDISNATFSYIFKRLRESYGFSVIENSQAAYRRRRDEVKRRAEQERNDRENQRRLERIYMNRYRSQNIAPRPRLNVIRQRMPVADENKAPREELPPAPVNRSSYIPLHSEEASIKSSSSDVESSSSSESSREPSREPSLERVFELPQEIPVSKLDLLPRRSEEEKARLLEDIHGTITEEDVKYLEIVHKQECQKKNHDIVRPFGSEYANRVHLKKLVIEGKATNHPSWWHGCSRCDIINVRAKAHVQEEETNYQDLTTAPIKSNVIQVVQSSRRDNRGDQRRIATLNADLGSDVIKMYTTNTLQMRAKNLRFSRSKIHKWGLFACEKIASGDAVIEYVGEKIRPSVADHREKNLPSHEGSSYFFRVDHDVIDATLKGNKARFINHSCNPNCIARVIKHDNGSNSIVIYAKQPIQEDEEITYNYKFPIEDNKIRCMCKAPNCKGFLN